jgi:hypothetical protein
MSPSLAGEIYVGGLGGTAQTSGSIPADPATTRPRLGRASTWLCIVAAAAFALLTFRYETRLRTAFLDDTFIYLHIAANIWDAGSAQYFPLTGLPALLASSPLKLATVTLPLGALHLAGWPLRALDTARLTLFASGLVANAVFLPFWWGRLRLYAALLAVFWACACAFPAVLDMESGLVLLATTTWLLELGGEVRAVRLGLLVGLLGMTRPELGAVAGVVTLIRLAWRPDSPRAVLRALGGLYWIVAPYVFLAAVLHVYPVPLTIWAKQVTSAQSLFSAEPFFSRFSWMLGSWFSDVRDTGTWVVGGLALGSWIVALASAALRCGRLASVLAVSGGVLVVVVYGGFPSNYVWYFENLFLLLVAITLVALSALAARGARGHAGVVALIALAVVAPSLYHRFLVNPDYPWDFEKPGHAQIYLAIAQGYQGHGVYRLANFPPAHLLMCEIGIVSYLSGTDTWLHDSCGLHQIGNLKGAYRSPLRRLYPRSLWISSRDLVRRAHADGQPSKPVLQVWVLGAEAVTLRAACSYVEGMLCISVVRPETGWGWRRDDLYSLRS